MTPIRPLWIKLPNQQEYFVPPPSPISVSSPHSLDEFTEEPGKKVWGYYDKEILCMSTSKTYKCESCKQVFEVMEDDTVLEEQDEDLSIVCEECFKEIKQLEATKRK